MTIAMALLMAKTTVNWLVTRTRAMLTKMMLETCVI